MDSSVQIQVKTSWNISRSGHQSHGTTLPLSMHLGATLPPRYWCWWLPRNHVSLQRQALEALLWACLWYCLQCWFGSRLYLHCWCIPISNDIRCRGVLHSHEKLGHHWGLPLLSCHNGVLMCFWAHGLVQLGDSISRSALCLLQKQLYIPLCKWRWWQSFASLTTRRPSQDWVRSSTPQQIASLVGQGCWCSLSCCISGG